jgi:DNA-binding HxlR family transcriptional regulator
MLKRFNLPSCPVETALMMMGDRWKVLIVRNLLTGTKRFGEVNNHHQRWWLECGL